MKRIETYARSAIALLVVALFAGCVHVKQQPNPAARGAKNVNAGTLGDTGLKKVLEQGLGHPVATWPLESWDFPKLTLAALYFHPGLEAAWTQRRAQRITKAESPADSTRLRLAASAWRVRATLRSNLLAYVAAQHRQELLRDLESTQMELAQIVERRIATDATPPVELSLLRLQLAETRLELIQSLQKKMDFRERVADSIGLPVKALLDVEVTYDFSTAAGYGPSTRELRRDALRNRSDVLLALADYSAAEAALRRELTKRHPHVRFNTGCSWDSENSRWALNLRPELPADSGREPLAKAEARRIAAAAQLLNLQTEVIDELDRRAAAYRERLRDTVVIERLLAAIARQHNAVERRFKIGDALRLEVILSRMQLVPAELAALDAQEKLQEALGALEDATQVPAEPLASGLVERGNEF